MISFHFRLKTIRARTATVVILLCCGTASSLQAQCTTLCADLNLSGAITSSDIIALTNYVLEGTAPPASDHGCMDIDDHLGVTAYDLGWMVHYVAWGGPLPDCDSDNSAWIPLANPGNQLNYNNLIPPGDTLVTLHFDATTAIRAQAFSFVMRILVDGQPPVLSGAASVDNADEWDFEAMGDSSTAVVPPGHLMGGLVDYHFAGEQAGRYTIGRVDIAIPSSAIYREITIELVEWPPGDHTPMVLERSCIAVWAINLQPWVVDLTGDANNDRMLSSADVIGLVNFVFKSGPTPYPVPATGDVNCSGDVTSSDIIGLVNHVFKGEPGPCDVAVECSINLDQWTCP